MITLYHCAAARSFRPLWMLEKLGRPYELKMLPFPPRVFAREYLALNPLGTIPFMIDGETKMTESSGICHYLGTRYGPTPLVVGVDDPAYGAFLNWMYFSDATLTFPQTLVLRYSQLEPEERRNPQVAGDYAKWFLGRLRAVEAATANAETLVAGRFTAADIVIGYALRLAENIGLAKDFGPNVAAYWQRLQQRDGLKRAGAAEDLAGVEQKGARRSEGAATLRKSPESPAFPDICVGDIGRDCCILARLRERARARRQEALARSREGRTMNDDDRRESGRLMLISPERVFYAGRLGRPRKRTGGGFSIYAVMQGSLRITEGKSEVIGEVAVVPP